MPARGGEPTMGSEPIAVSPLSPLARGGDAERAVLTKTTGTPAGARGEPATSSPRRSRGSPPRPRGREPGFIVLIGRREGAGPACEIEPDTWRYISLEPSPPAQGAPAVYGQPLGFSAVPTRAG